MMRILSVASECVPFIKTGGLADVAGALPLALAPLDIEMRTLLPGYPQVLAAIGDSGKTVLDAVNLFGGSARVIEAEAAGLKLYVIDAPHLFEREGGPYLDAQKRDWPDNAERFAGLSNIAAMIGAGKVGNWQPDVVHLHDWQAALTPIYLQMEKSKNKPATVLTIHNIAFQGIVDAGMLGRLGLPKSGFTKDGFEYYGKISALKAGIVFSDRVSTVSPTYATELLSPEFGMGLEGVLRVRSTDFSGILNGIDLDAWSPPYKTARGKEKYKKQLLSEAGLPSRDGPLFVVVSRLSEQKGLDTLLEALAAIFPNGGQIALLGSGDPDLERSWRAAGEVNPDISVRIGYDEDYAKRLIMGGDAILVPSRFEPCGLTQLYGLRYGTIPVVAMTGGLADTVIPANPAGLARGVATGLQVYPNTTDAWARALGRTCLLFKQKDEWRRLQKNAMQQPVGWDVSAAAYRSLYKSIGKPR
jgi:starch synthase